MPRQMFPIDIFESNMNSWVVPVPDHAVFRGLAVDPKNPDCFHLWFEGDPEFHPTTKAFRIVKGGEEIPEGMTLLGSDLSFGRHVFWGKHKAKCRCECHTNHPGLCTHDWNGPYVMVDGVLADPVTCSNCGESYNKHGPSKARPLTTPRLRNKSARQKDDCIACNERPSTKEVVWKNAQIRCCGNPDCIEKATEIALAAAT